MNHYVNKKELFTIYYYSSKIKLIIPPVLFCRFSSKLRDFLCHSLASVQGSIKQSRFKVFLGDSRRCFSTEHWQHHKTSGDPSLGTFPRTEGIKILHGKAFML